MKDRCFAINTIVNANDIKRIRNKYKLTQEEFAQLVNVTVNTVEKWESKQEPIKGTIVSLIKLLEFNPSAVEKLRIPEQETSIRLYYMYHNEICTVIDVDDRKQKVNIYNYVLDNIYKAFGNNETPTYQEYIEFLKSRCFPEERDHLKLVLKDLNLPFYDPFMIVEKTEGRMAEDDFWIKIRRK